jgi:pectate lyase
LSTPETHRVCSPALWLVIVATALLAACGGTSELDRSGAEASADDSASAEAQAVRAVSNVPTGFAAGVTGGAGGNTFRVSTVADLKRELCRTSNGNGCTDTEPRIIEVASVIDLTDSEGSASAPGCFATSVCTGATQKSEITLNVQDWQKSYCTGKQTSAYKYKVAGTTALLIGSNKTLIGVGANAGLKGKGVILQGGVSNIIIRNLSFTDINEGMVWGGDGLSIPAATKVWVDHNRFARIGRQFIVLGNGDATATIDGITLSNNELDGRSAWSARCTGNHYWNLLAYGNGRITIANNYLHHFDGRAPRFNSAGSGALVHIVNNYFETGGWHALDYEGANTRVLMEGNHFRNVSMPVLTDATGNGQLFGVYGQTSATKATCIAAIGRPCNPNIASPAPATDKLVQDSAVLTAFKPLAGGLIKPISANDVPDTVKAHAGVGKI